MRDLKFLLVLLILVGIGCSNQGLMTSEAVLKVDVLQKNYKVIVLDECEYIQYDYRSYSVGYGYLAHKGNCKNTYHKDNQ